MAFTPVDIDAAGQENGSENVAEGDLIEHAGHCSFLLCPDPEGNYGIMCIAGHEERR